MKRIAQLVATATIAVMLGTIAARFVCAAECDRARPVAAKSDHCHGDATAPTRVGTADDCTQHTVQASGSIARTEPVKVFSADLSITPGPRPAEATSVVSFVFVVQPPATSPGPQNIPLRI